MQITFARVQTLKGSRECFVDLQFEYFKIGCVKIVRLIIWVVQFHLKERDEVPKCLLPEVALE